jgi:twitching motility protein PilT
MVTSNLDRKLGETLVERRLLSQDDLEAHLATVGRTGDALSDVLLSAGEVDHEDLLRAVAEHLGVGYVDLASPGAAAPEPRALRAVPHALAAELGVLPLRLEMDGTLVVAMENPLDEARVEPLRKLVDADVKPELAAGPALRAAIVRSYEAVPVASSDTTAPGGDDAHQTPSPSANGSQRPDPSAEQRFTVGELLMALTERKGSDLHLAVGAPPMMRIDGALQPLEECGKLGPSQLRKMIYAMLTGRQREQLEENLELDLSFPLRGIGRFRANVFFQRDSIGAVLRAIPNQIIPLDELGIPTVVASFAQLRRGLVLVTGPTGSGKSTTLASIIDLINTARACHIITLEDPIEFTHRHKTSLVNQREIGSDTRSFAAALRHALRQDPDVILLGEMRDLETISTAITAAETGHLILATLHTQDAPQSVERMIDVFPSHQQRQVRVQLANSLQAVVSQQLLPRADGKGRVAAVEVMVATGAIRNLIRDGKVHQIRTAMQSGGKFGMETMDGSLAQLVKAGTVTYDTAFDHSRDPDGFEILAGRRKR